MSSPCSRHFADSDRARHLLELDVLATDEGQLESEATVAAKKAQRRYGKKASDKVAKVMRERKAGTLRSGGSGKKVTSRKQAIAIGL